jgi:glutamate dehydrogenase (NAD(P)+)
MKIDVSKARVIVQGFGNVGSVSAKIFAELGARVVGISDVSGAYYNAGGIDVAGAIAYAQEHHSLEGYRGGERLSNAQILEQPCDVLVPAALEDQITLENAARIQARLIVEGANGPTRPEADHVLARNGIVVVPDIIANAGGVIVSYFEWCQDRAGFFWKESEVVERLKDHLIGNFRQVRALSKSRRISLRTAAYVVAIDRVVKALRMRGVYA